MMCEIKISLYEDPVFQQSFMTKVYWIDTCSVVSVSLYDTPVSETGQFQGNQLSPQINILCKQEYGCCLCKLTARLKSRLIIFK